MKKLIALLSVLVIVLSFAGCAQKNEEETTTADASVAESSTSSVQDNTTEAVSEDVNEDSTAAGTTLATTKPATTHKQTTTQKNETTTKRKIRLNVKFPYYSSYKTVIKIEYKESKDKKYKELISDEEIVLDKAKTQSYDIKENLIGDVDVRVTIDGVELLKNDFVVSGRDSESTIELVSGTEMLDGGFD